MMEWRLINSGHQDGYNNMAIDEAVFASMANSGNRPTLRIYGWSPPAISIGYFQKIEKGKAGEIDIVRRLTGGGAILHDQELTFCLVTTLEDSVVPNDIFASYDFISRAVTSGLQSLGISARIRADEEAAEKQAASKKEEPFFCFDRSSRYDIIFEGKKIAGSAQRRKNGVLLHHGSILLNEQGLDGSTSISSILNRKVGFGELCENIIQGFEKELSVNLIPGELTGQELQLSRQLAMNKSRAKWGQVGLSQVVDFETGGS